MILRLALLWLAALAGMTQGALAHEIRPAYLQVREIEPEVYDFLWKTPARGDMRCYEGANDIGCHGPASTA